MIVGGGLAGLSAAAKLGAAGLEVDLHEARTFLGGRAASFPLRPGDPRSERIDNCQHVLLRRCTALMDFYRRCGVADRIRFHATIPIVSPGGTVDCIAADPLPVPLHLARSLLSMQALDWRDKASVVRCLLAVRRQRRRSDLDSLTFTRWLDEHGATPRAVARFWRPFVVSALNEEPDRASALPALQVFGDGLLGGRSSYEIGIPTVTLDELYSGALAGHLGRGVRVHLGSKVGEIDPGGGEADYYVSAVPFDRVAALLPGSELGAAVRSFEHSPIAGIHLWFDRRITDLDHAMLLDRNLQWVFHRGEGYYLAVVSAARGLESMPTAAILRLAVSELREFFPESRNAALASGRVIREARATYSARPGLERLRPGVRTEYSNVFLAGDWTSTGWPATMEGAVRSGYAAADAILEAEGLAVPRRPAPARRRTDS